jgi:uncharacterized protein (TIGR02145 family)
MRLKSSYLIGETDGERLYVLTNKKLNANKMKKLISLVIFLSVILFSPQTNAQTTVNLADTVKASLAKAQVLARQGNTEEASKIYLRIMEYYPDNRDAVQGWLIANMKRTPTGEAGAMKQLEELGKLYPNNTGIIFFIAFIQAESGNNEEALKNLETLIKMQPDTALYYIGKGQVLSAMKKYQEAFEAFDKATSLDPKRPDVWGMKADALSKMGKFDDALTTINKGIELAPNYPNGIYNRACIYSLKGDKANALADLGKAISMNPGFKKSAVKDEDFKSLYDDENFKKLTSILSVGQKAPDFTLNDVNGKPVSLSSKIGPKLLLIDFWAGWCAPCRKENPNVLKVYNEFKEKGFEIIGVSLDRTKDMWIQAINDDKLPWTQVSDLNYFNSEAAKRYDVVSIPANYLLDEKGIIIAMNLRGGGLYNEIKRKLAPETVIDVDGNVYNAVTIGNQVWMLENLKTTKYSNGDPIPNVTDSAEWRNLSAGAYCNYNNDIKNGNIYGRLYNWYAVNDPRQIAPKGWHVASEAEWEALISYLGGEKIAGMKLRETGTAHWRSPNPGANNESGFTALPGGYREYTKTFTGLSMGATFFTSTEKDEVNAWSYFILPQAQIGKSSYSKLHGRAVRCVKD